MLYFSASQVETYERCPRAWGFAKIEKRPTRSSAAQEFGTTAHEHAAAWLTRGANPPKTPEGEAFRQGIKHLPPPSDAHVVEAKFDHACPDVADDVRLIGYMDLRQSDTIVDHKFTKDLRYAKSPDALATEAQPVIYAKVAIDGGANAVLLRWIYYQATGEPVRKPRGTRVVEFLHTPETVAEPWARIVESMKRMRTAKLNVLDANDLEPNPSACDDYGGCEFRSICNLGSVRAGIGAAVRQHLKIHRPSQEDTNMASDALKERLAKMRGGKIEARGVNPPPQAPAAPVTVKRAAPTPVQDDPEETPAPRKAPAPAARPAGKFVVMIDAHPVKGAENTKHLHELLAPTIQALSDEHGHWNAVEYGQGPTLLAKALDTWLVANPFAGVLLVDGSTAEARAVKEVLYSHASVVIRGLR